MAKEKLVQEIEVQKGKISNLDKIFLGVILNKGGVKELVIEKTPNEIKTLRRMSIDVIYKISYSPIEKDGGKYLKLEFCAVYEKDVMLLKETYEELNSELLKKGL